MHSGFKKIINIAYIDCCTPSFQTLTHLSVESAKKVSLASAETKSPGCVRKTKWEVSHFSSLLIIKWTNAVKCSYYNYNYLSFNKNNEAFSFLVICSESKRPFFCHLPGQHLRKSEHDCVQESVCESRRGFRRSHRGIQSSIFRRLSVLLLHTDWGEWDNWPMACCK